MFNLTELEIATEGFDLRFLVEISTTSLECNITVTIQTSDVTAGTVAAHFVVIIILYRKVLCIFCHSGRKRLSGNEMGSNIYS